MKNTINLADLQRLLVESDNGTEIHDLMEKLELDSSDRETVARVISAIRLTGNDVEQKVTKKRDSHGKRKSKSISILVKRTN